MRNFLACCGLVFIALFSASAAVADRIAVVVGNQVITESEVDQEVRLTEFLNDQPVDLSPEQRRAAAGRLVDQQLIRNELEIGKYPEPPESDAEAMLRKFRQEHYRSTAQFQPALEKYGITEEELKQHLLWQLTAIRFTDERFQPGNPLPPVNAANRFESALTGRGAQSAGRGGATSPQRVQSADRLRAGSAQQPEGNTVDERLDAWLKQARSETRIDFKQEAFQ